MSHLLGWLQVRTRSRFIFGALATLPLIGVVAACIYSWDELNQYYNASQLVHRGLDGRVACHRINRLPKLQAMLDTGLRSVEVDLVVRERGDHVALEVGHGSKDTRGVTLDSYLHKVRPHRLKKIWLDIKNLKAHNITMVLTALRRLDASHGIRAIAIVESSLDDEALKTISGSGFHTSYYLPTGRIKKLLQQDDQQGLEREAARIGALVRRQGSSAVSFDSAIYGFVKEYLEPKVDAKVVYHTWYSVKLYSWAAIAALERKPYFQDSRVVTILASFKIPFYASVERAAGRCV